MDNLLQQGVIAYKAGKRDEARKCFIAAIKQNRDNERAWQFMYNLANDDKERLSCLQQILRINPQNEKAQQLLDNLTDFVPPLEHPNDHPQALQPIQQQIQRPLDLAYTAKGDSNINALQKYADHLIKMGWTIASMNDRQFIATKRKDINGLVLLIGITGLCAYLIPGLLILLIGYIARGTETQIVTDTTAQAWLREKEKQAEKLQSEEKARKAANNQKIAELSDSPLRYWYMMSSNQRILLIIVIIIPLYLLFMGILQAIFQAR